MSTSSASCPSRGWSSSLRATLDQAIERSLREHDTPLAVFDCDNTCIRGDIGDVLWEYLVREKALCFSHEEIHRLVSLVDPDPQIAFDLAAASSLTPEYLERWLPMYPAASNKLGYAAGLTWVTQIMTGIDESSLRDHCARSVAEALNAPLEREDELLSSPGIRLCEEVSALIAELQERGFLCAIVSASCRWPVQAVAPYLGIDPAHVLAIDMVVDGSGILTSEIIPPVTYRQGKLDAILARFERPPQMVFGDAITDYEMLARATSLGVLIDRGNEDILEAIAPHEHIVAQPRDELSFVSTRTERTA